MTNYNDGRWHGFNGEKLPLHNKTQIIAVVQVEFEEVEIWRRMVGEAPWKNIIAFRVIREHREPREFWISLNNGGIFNSPQENAIHVREVIEE